MINMEHIEAAEINRAISQLALQALETNGTK
jgi:hypothetical protein